MTEYKRIVDIINRSAVVVNQNYLFALFVKLSAFERGFDVRVHDNQQSSGGYALYRLGRSDEHFAFELFSGVVNKLTRH